MKIDGRLSADEIFAELQSRVMRQLMDEQTTQSFDGALRADPNKVVVSARDARASVENLQRLMAAGR